MIYEIKNEYLQAKINTFGAELFSLIHLNSNYECIWQGDEKYWNGHSPILFPFCGRLFQEKYQYQGKIYQMPIHGFASQKEFTLLEKKDDEICFQLSEGEDTLQHYPFKFRLIVGYKLVQEKLIFSFKVINDNDYPMYFSLGGHPAFNCPINGVGHFDDYYVEFTNHSLLQRIFSKNVLYTGEKKEYPLQDRKLRLNHHLFDFDAIFFELKNHQETLLLKTDLSKSYIKMEINKMNTVGFWHTNRTEAPFICMEPSLGFPGREGIIENLETLLDVEKIESKQEYQNSYFVIVHIEKKML